MRLTSEVEEEAKCFGEHQTMSIIFSPSNIVLYQCYSLDSVVQIFVSAFLFTQ